MTSTSNLLSLLFGEAPFFGAFGYAGKPERHMFLSAALQRALPADRPVRILEIGSWVGSSALTWAQSIRTFSPHGGSITCVDPWISFSTTNDLANVSLVRTWDELLRSGLAHELFLHNTKSIVAPLTREVRRGKAADILPTLEMGTYDLVYIDGSHYYDDVLQDLKLAAPLLRDGGILCGDDLEAQIGDVDLALVRQSLEKDNIPHPSTGVGFHPGVTLACHEFFGGRVPSVVGFWCARKSAGGFVDPDFTNLSVIIPDHFTEDMKDRCKLVLSGISKQV